MPMTKRSAILFIVFILVLAPVILWLFAVRIANVLIPPLLKSETVQVNALHIASLGIHTVEVKRLTGRLQIPTGIIRFDIDNATIFYDLFRLQPKRIDVKKADIAYEPIAVSRESRAGKAGIALPADVSIDQLHFTYDRKHEFAGRLEYAGSGENFTLLAHDNLTRLKISSDSSFSAFDIAVDQADETRIAHARIELIDSEPAVFDLSVRLEPALPWLRSFGYVPATFKPYLHEIGSISGNIRSSGHRNPSGKWKVGVDLDLQNFAADVFYANARIRGNLDPLNNDWTFTSTQAGYIRINIPGNQLDDISSITVNLPDGYKINQGFSQINNFELSGSGRAPVNILHMVDTDLNADLTHWTLSNFKEVGIELRDLRAMVPKNVHADRARSNFTVTNTSPLLITGDVKMTGAASDDWMPDMPGVDVNGKWNWNDGSLDIEGDAGWNSSKIGQWSLVSHETSGELLIDFSAPVVDLVRPMKDYLKKNQYDIAFSDGSVEGSFSWTWDNNRYDNHLGLTAVGVHGRILGLEFENGTMKLNTSDLIAPTLMIQGQIPLVRLASDVDVTELSVSGRWQNGFHLDQASMAVLGGTLSIEPVFLDPGKSTYSVALQVDNIGLERVLELVDQDGLTGTGQLNGTIPLRLSESALAIDDGHLINTTKGSISYDPGVESTPQLDNIAMQALRDFRYDLLDATLNYQINGDYGIGARLEGRNPNLYDGYPIAFNINLTGTLPGLLRASILTGDFTEEILREIQNEQQGQ